MNKKDEFDIELLNSLSLDIVPEYICVYEICISIWKMSIYSY